MPDAVALAMVEALPAVAPTVGWQAIGMTKNNNGGTLTGSTVRAAAVSTDGTRIYVSHGVYQNANGAGEPISGDINLGQVQTITPDGTVTVGPSVAFRQGVAGAWCNGKHYAIGGFDSGGNNVGNVESYTPAGTNGASGVWSSAASVPQPKGYMAAAVIGTSIYVAGGQGFTSSANTASNALLRYDTTNNTWSTLANMPAARTQGAMVAVGSKLYYLGGLDSSGGGTTTVYVYDTTAGTWSNPGWTANIAVQNNVAVAINGNAYYLGGANLRALNLSTGVETLVGPAPDPAHGNGWGWVSIGSVIYDVSGTATANVDKLDLGAGTSYTSAVLGAKSLLNPLLAGVASILPNTPPTDTTGKAQYAQTVQTLRALAAIS